MTKKWRYLKGWSNRKVVDTLWSPRFSPWEWFSSNRQVSGSEGEEMQEVPLSRSSKAVSLAAGLNRLQAEEDEPDGEGSSAGQASFLHSKCKIIRNKLYNIWIFEHIFQTWPTPPTTCLMLEARRRRRRKKANTRRNPTESPGLLRSLSAWETPSAMLTNDHQSMGLDDNLTSKTYRSAAF